MDNGASSYRRYLDGDESAFVEVQKLYFDNLTFFINRYVKDLAAAEDIAIDTMVDLIVHRYRYNFKTSLKTYLFSIGRHKAIDYLRHHRKTTFVDLSEADGFGIGSSDAEHDMLEETVLADERRRIVNAALDKLPENMRIAVHLVYFEGLTYADAARVMKKNRKQIDNLLYRAKAELRSIIGKEGELLL
ncbi:MAG: RNA polymerase sigma factor [Christensenellaceae bacterium]|nr:RNA polymerase sigma factor [Christensenellaceae bacterium]